MTDHIYPVLDDPAKREQREKRLQQRSKIIWLTGLSGAGKSTIAQALEQKLFELGYFVQLLDGDNIRSGLNKNLGFSEQDRSENIRRIAEVAKLYLHSGVIVICSFVSPMQYMRQLAKDIIGEQDFLEIFINTPLQECERRDVKGLYAKARKGEIKNFTGIGAPYEIPKQPFLSLSTDGSAEQSVLQLFRAIEQELVFV